MNYNIECVLKATSLYIELIIYIHKTINLDLCGTYFVTDRDIGLCSKKLIYDSLLPSQYSPLKCTVSILTKKPFQLTKMMGFGNINQIKVFRRAVFIYYLVQCIYINILPQQPVKRK